MFLIKCHIGSGHFAIVQDGIDKHKHSSIMTMTYG